ncbi:MAG: hypothetical protein KAX78_02445 [Phycisphaerae bacterium]|nr:hypothetical protein [Phycisphaerae bacterium]
MVTDNPCGVEVEYDVIPVKTQGRVNCAAGDRCANTHVRRVGANLHLKSVLVEGFVVILWRRWPSGKICSAKTS